MARHEADREDLFDEFRSAMQKWEVQPTEAAPPVVCGIRKDGRRSIYLDQDHCYHFNEHCQLMRAYHAGSLYRTQGRTLAKLTRERTASETILHRVDLSEDQLAEFLDNLQDSLSALLESLSPSHSLLLRAVPPEADISEMIAVIRSLCERNVQLAPAYATRRN